VSLRFRVKNVGSKNKIHQKSAPYAYREDAGRKEHGRALFDEGSAPLTSNEDDPIVTDAVALAVGEGNGTYKTSSFAQSHEGSDMQDPQWSQMVWLQAIELQHQAEESMRGHTEPSLIECQTRHEVFPHRSKGSRIHRNATSSQFSSYHILLTYENLQVLLHGLRRVQTGLHHGMQGTRETTTRKLNNPLSYFSDLFSLFSLSLFSHREGGGGTVGYHVRRCRLCRSYHTSFIAP
jgi:hypothetical protein